MPPLFFCLAVAVGVGMGIFYIEIPKNPFIYPPYQYKPSEIGNFPCSSACPDIYNTHREISYLSEFIQIWGYLIGKNQVKIICNYDTNY